MIKEGDKAPEFTLPTVNGPLSLADFRGKQLVVLYWYPKDDTPGCTTEACSFRDNLAVLQSRGVAVIGASADSVESHRKFAEKYGLPFPLVADVDHQVAEQYGVWSEKSMYGRTFWGVDRTTFLIDEEGIVRKVWRKVDPKAHVPEVIAAVDELRQ
ncbi:MAG: thioredoxin-dependent thiol peroxidase [Chloroflexi bacterium]|nr:thioredoxin-dependent thiol peroxidase [Chloroflexota bacterium]